MRALRRAVKMEERKKKEERRRKKKPPDENIMACSIPYGGHS